MIGGTLMRQHAFVFDIENHKIGISRAMCSYDKDMVVDDGQVKTTDFIKARQQQHKVENFFYKPVKVEDHPEPAHTDNLAGVSDDTDDGSYAHPTNGSEFKDILCILAIVLILFSFVYCCIRTIEQKEKVQARARKVDDEDEIQLQTHEDDD